MTWTALDTWIVVIGVLAAAPCALLGAFLVLRRMSMMGDAISHAVLPGIAGAFLVTVFVQTTLPVEDLPAWLQALVMTDARSGPIMFVGAVVVGVLTALFTQAVHQYGQVEQSAAMGVVFTTLFALGLIMIVRAADAVDLDPGCVLYGAIELAPRDTVSVLGLLVPRAVVTLGVVAVVDLAFVVLLFKELRITSFDPELGATLGMHPTVMHYLLMTLVAVTSVAAFEAVGSILVVAMLIVPAATAHLLSDRLLGVVTLSVLIGAAGAALGHLGAITVPTWFGFADTSTAGSMAVATGLLFALACVLAPRYGIVSRVLDRRHLARRIEREDVLGLLYRMDEHRLPARPAEVERRLQDALGFPPRTTRRLLARLVRQGLLVRSDGIYRMTDAGRAQATDLVRSHRLWEAYLVKHLALPPDHVHDTAMHLEHLTDAAMRERLARHADDPEVDPHGRSIPGA